MLRRILFGVVLGILLACVATPAQAAEWCLNDPALIFSTPHSHVRLTIYATEGVQGASHAAALTKAHLDFNAHPGKHAGLMDIQVKVKIEGNDHDSFATVLVVSSRPYGAGRLYGVVTGTSSHDMQLNFEFAYPSAG
jgi:hypothetical protein